MEGQWTEIISAADPRVSLFRNLKGHDARLVGRVLVEGDQQLSRFLALNLPIEQIFLEERFCNELAPYLTSARLQGANCFFATRSVMQDILGYRLHQGCFLTTPRPAEPNELRGPVVALAGINDPENVGAIARSAAAFGVKTILWIAAIRSSGVPSEFRWDRSFILELSKFWISATGSALLSGMLGR